MSSKHRDERRRRSPQRSCRRNESEERGHRSRNRERRRSRSRRGRRRSGSREERRRSRSREERYRSRGRSRNESGEDRRDGGRDHSRRNRGRYRSRSRESRKRRRSRSGDRRRSRSRDRRNPDGNKRQRTPGSEHPSTVLQRQDHDDVPLSPILIWDHLLFPTQTKPVEEPLPKDDLFHYTATVQVEDVDFRLRDREFWVSYRLPPRSRPPWRTMRSRIPFILHRELEGIGTRPDEDESAPITFLPEEALCHVFSWLSLRALRRCAEVCHYWRVLSHFVELHPTPGTILQEEMNRFHSYLDDRQEAKRKTLLGFPQMFPIAAEEERIATGARLSKYQMDERRAMTSTRRTMKLEKMLLAEAEEKATEEEEKEDESEEDGFFSLEAMKIRAPFVFQECLGRYHLLRDLRRIPPLRTEGSPSWTKPAPTNQRGWEKVLWQLLVGEANVAIAEWSHCNASDEDEGTQRHWGELTDLGGNGSVCSPAYPNHPGSFVFDPEWRRGFYEHMGDDTKEEDGVEREEDRKNVVEEEVESGDEEKDKAEAGVKEEVEEGGTEKKKGLPSLGEDIQFGYHTFWKEMQERFIYGRETQHFSYEKVDRDMWLDMPEDTTWEEGFMRCGCCIDDMDYLVIHDKEGLPYP